MRDDAVLSTTPERQAEAMERLGATPRSGAIPAIAVPMHQGLDGLMRPVTVDGRAAMLKTFHRGLDLPSGFDGAAEACRAAAEAGVAPDLLAVEQETRSLLFADLGEGWRQAGLRDLIDPECLSAVLAVKKSWHAKGRLSGHLSPREEFGALLARWKAADLAPLPVTLRMGADQIADWVKLICAALEADEREAVALHGENALSNVMISETGAIRLVDFDRAVMGDAFRDLGALSLELCADDVDRAALLTAWTGVAPTPLDMARLKLNELLDDAIQAFRAMLGEAEPDRKGPELYKYASNRLVRLRTNLSDFDMAKLLREV